MADLTGQHLGQYQILARINKGATSTIYKAYQPKLDRFVAIKVLSPHVVDEEGFLERFSQEARAVAQLDHPNIVPVYDFDQVGDIAYIVFKHVEGGTLRQMMADRQMDLRQAVDIVTQIGLALSYAHRRGVIHRDVKPTNILIGEGCWAMLTDFGLAKILSGGRQLTRSGIGMGTPDYMAPEQAQGIPGDGRADIYSLGATLYEMLTAHVPFQADSSMGVVVKHITEPPAPPSKFNPAIPPAVESVILTALEKDPDKRFRTAEAMVAALVRAAGPAAEPETETETDRVTLSALRAARVKPAPLKGLPARVRQMWSQITSATWHRLSRRGRIALGGAALIALVVLVAWGGLISMRPATHASLLPTDTSSPPPATKTATATTTATVPPTAIPATPTAQPSPTPGLTDTPMPTPTMTPTLIFLSASAAIRPGIYVKAIKSDGVNLRKGAGFDSDYMMTLPMGRVLYVLQGPVRADNLSWFRLSDTIGGWIGWTTQDEIVAYARKPTP